MNYNETINRTDGNIIVTKDLEKHFKSGGDKVKAVDGINISIPRGKMVAIRGSSGSGKSTFLNLIGALDKPSSGSIVVDGVDVSKIIAAARAEYVRRKGLRLPERLVVQSGG